MNFIEQTTLKVNLVQVQQDLEDVLGHCSWNWSDQDGIGNSIGLNHRPGAENPWTDNWGSLVDPKTGNRKATELDFSEWNKNCPAYTKSVVENLAEQEGFQIGRVRYLRLDKKTGLTVHQDFEPRYHLAIKTTPFSFFGKVVNDQEESALCYNIPADGYFYKADTTKPHFVYNGSWEDRIHLVICAL
jgi:hypothetical protein